MDGWVQHFVIVHVGFAIFATWVCPLANALGIIGGPSEPSALVFMALCAALLKWFVQG